jgi:hypothetical protein
MTFSDPFQKTRNAFHIQLCQEVLQIGGDRIATNADVTNRASREIALKLAMKLGCSSAECLDLKTVGDRFRQACTGYLKEACKKLSGLTSAKWVVVQISEKESEIAKLEPYPYLCEFARLEKENPKFKTILGSDSFIKPDIAVLESPEGVRTTRLRAMARARYVASNPSGMKKGSRKYPHCASISCKWTIRSDRTQNSRSEALNLIRNRKGNAPHIMVVTGEPLPGRLASICLGAGDIDCVYHFALPELSQTLSELNYPDAADTLKTLIEGRRLRDISDLPLDLAV